MDKYYGISKGVFNFKPYTIGKNKKKFNSESKDRKLKDDSCYEEYSKYYHHVENLLSDIRTNTFDELFQDLKKYVKNIQSERQTNKINFFHKEIPTAILLAGVNLSDHHIMFQKVVTELKNLTSNIAMVWSRDVSNIKNLTESVIFQLINGTEHNEETEDFSISKNQCTFQLLAAWHRDKCLTEDHPLIIIIPDFESFSSNLLHDFIIILSSLQKKMNFIIMIGVATTLHVVHRSLSFEATSKLKVKVFRTKTQMQILSNVFNQIIISSKIPFKLMSNVFNTLMEVFLFNDLSVNSFLQSYKLCLMMHFHKNMSTDNAGTSQKSLKECQKLPSVSLYMQSKKLNSIPKDSMKNLKNELFIYMENFFISLQILQLFIEHVPSTKLGQNLRELYVKSVSRVNIYDTEEYKEALKLTEYYQKDVLLKIMTSILQIDFEISQNNESMLESLEKLRCLTAEVTSASTEVTNSNNTLKNKQVFSKRTEFLAGNKENAEKKFYSPYKKAQQKLIDFMDKNFFQKYLKSPYHIPLHELYYYDDMEMKSTIKGSFHGLINLCLNQPACFLQCQCCRSADEGFSSFPDLNMLHKLHLECNKDINLYDMLQSFLMICGQNDSDKESTEVDYVKQARFDKALTELQFLGFIKSTKKKTDHVKKLYW